MKTLITMLLLFVSTSTLATGKLIDNTDWRYETKTLTWPDSENVSGKPDGHESILTSSMRGSDISLQYTLTMYRRDTGAPQEVNGWDLTIKFNGELKAVDIHSMSLGYNLGGKWHRIDGGWHIEGDDIVIPMTIDNIMGLHEGVEYAAPASIEFWYRPKEESIEEATLDFNFKNGYDPRFHEFTNAVRDFGGDVWLQGTAYFRSLPINELPNDKKPTPSAMVKAAEDAGIDIDTAYTLSINEIVKLTQDKALAELKAKKAEEDRLYAIEQAKRAEEARLKALAEEKAKQQESAQQEENLKAARRSIRDFDWPSDNCGSPARPSVNASDRQVDKANRRNETWHDCMDESYQDDQRALQRLIDNLSSVGGTWEWTNRTERRWTFKIWTACKCIDMLSNLRDEIYPRHELRQDAARSFNNWVDNRNDKVASEEMWDGINESLDNMSRDMDRMYRERQQWQSQQIYISPGYY